MVRRLKSPSRTITARGERKFTGEFPCMKSAHTLVFDSITALLGGVFLEHRRDVVRMSFEPEVSTYRTDNPELSEPIRAFHDYHVVLDTGELEKVETKYSPESLNPEEARKLELLGRFLRESGEAFSVVFRSELEADGFIDTVLLLRRFGAHAYSDSTVARAFERLEQPNALTLDQWRKRAALVRVPTGVLYHLLYQQRLPLKYVPLTCVEFSQCRDSSA